MTSHIPTQGSADLISAVDIHRAIATGTSSAQAVVEQAFARINAIEGLSAVRPKGAFYVLASIAKFDLSSTNFADRLLSKANVAVVPGIAFGDPPGADRRLRTRARGRLP